MRKTKIICTIGPASTNEETLTKMFEAGIELRKEFGAENVYDFSLGNPDLPPPAKVQTVLHNIADKVLDPFSLGYMPNGGYVEVREVLAAKLSKEQGINIPMSNVIATCGAAGGLNVFFRTVLEKGDEIIGKIQDMINRQKETAEMN